MENRFFNEVKGRFGFGCMRLPMKQGEVDYETFRRMVDRFMDAGLNYFDTAHGYLDEKSEIAIRECLVRRYPREAFILTNKLSQNYFQKEEDIRPLFEKQLECCGVDYFDFYLMHAQGRGCYDQYQNARAYEVAQELKKEGKVHHVGLSFHDNAEFLDKILTDHPEIEVVQIQFNYLDYEEETVQSRACYEVCVKHGVPVLVMEPVKGGSLINLPDSQKARLDALIGDSGADYASYALRFAEHFDQMFMVLSGMSNMEQMESNLSCMVEPKPLDENEMQTLLDIGRYLREEGQIPCTGCRYCTKDCPQQIAIPDIFSAWNVKKRRQDFPAFGMYQHAIRDNGKPEDCIKCGSCEEICPQHLQIRDLLEEAAEVLSRPPF
ncbi:MAG: aldo/keto reductase [Eubacteriales bacterium]|nr:aldo/keto reductase [Eubacteriales bacterium]